MKVEIFIKIERIEFSGLRNTRDLGQLYAVSGRKVKSNLLYRSGRIDKLSATKIIDFLNEYNIKTIIDLRTSVEVRESRNFEYHKYVDYYHIPVLNKQFFGITHENNSMVRIMLSQRQKINSQATGEDYMISMYESIVLDKSSQKHFKTLFDILCMDYEGAILFHCTSGKDRTGITTLFLYTLLGVSEEEILKDYESSDIFNKKYNQKRKRLIKIFMPTSKKTKSLLLSLLYAKRVYLEKTIEMIKEKYGSVLEFLYQEIKITKEMQLKLQEKYLES